MSIKARSGFGFVGLGQTSPVPSGLVSALFTSVAFDRIISRIEWSAHHSGVVTANTQLFVALVIFAGLDYPLTFNARNLTFEDPNNQPEILYCQVQTTGALNCNWQPMATEINFRLNAGRDYTVSISDMFQQDASTGVLGLYVPSGRTLNVFGGDQPPEKTHWR